MPDPVDLLLLPGLLYFIIFRYVPLLGNIIAFQAYLPFLGFASPFVGFDNYISGIQKTGLIQAAFVSLFVTVLAVAVIVLCTSMCAWYITRVHTKFTAGMYFLCLFSMIVPFQMVMFPLSKIANMLKLSNPLGLVFIYLGFGAGLAVFMFTGFVKSLPLAIEEAAMIDGCTPLQTFFYVVMPIMKPTGTVVVA